MKKITTMLFISVTASLLLILFAGHAVCWQPFAPGMGPMGAPGMGPMGAPGMGPMGAPGPPPVCGPQPMPFTMGPCSPMMGCTQFSVEGGARALYSTNSVKLQLAGGPEIDLPRNLNFSPNTVFGEVYAAVRMPPTTALTFTFMIPREDNGNGILPFGVTLGSSFFPAGTTVASKYELTVYRLEGEYYPILGCNYRAGGLLMGEILVRKLRMTTAVFQDQETSTDFIMGVGGVGEYSPSRNLFARVKGAYTFLQNQNGVYVDGEAKFFPDMTPGCGGPGMFTGSRPYVGGGYRCWWTEWNAPSGSGNKLTTVFYGPYVEAGIVF